jgi:mRNA-degrading endonuclease RelE of RelBE toxin-antitoxin system
MKTKVRVGRQVEDFLKALAPEPRRTLRLTMKNLADEKGDVKLLEGKLSGLWRLRAGKVRVIYET